MKNGFLPHAAMLAFAAVAGAGCNQSEPANESAASNGMESMANDHNNPFAQSEATMSQAMQDAVGVNVADSWVRKMIAHHQGAVDMSRVVLNMNPSAEVAGMAQQTIDMQSKEIADLQKLVATGAPDPASAALYRPAEQAMHAEMMAARGTDISETYLRKMLAHHKGAITMSDVALANGASGAVRAQIEKTRASQQKEVEMVEAMLSGSPRQTEQSSPAPAAAQSQRRPPASAERDRAAPARTPPPAVTPPPAAPKPPAAPTPECAPEHRAAGHC